MKHLQIFEQFNPDNKIKIGYFATGGIGSHPGIATESELIRCGYMGEGSKMNKYDYYFEELNEVNEVPEALLCTFYSDSLWDIRPISDKLANDIIALQGKSDYYLGDDIEHTDSNDEVIRKICEMSGLEMKNDLVVISVITNTKINTVYFSENPEKTHGYWESEGISPMSIEDFTKSGL